MLLIYDAEKDWQSRTEAEQQQIFSGYMTFTDEIKKSGHYIGGNALEATHTATTVRVREGKTLKTHGPFAETTEQLGGYYLIEAKDLDEACSIAARILSSKYGSIEVRPILPTPG